MTVPGFEVENLTVEYGRFTALAGVELSVPAGAFLAVLGPNGAGKSTLVKAALGLVPVVSGAIRFRGLSRAALGPSLIGYVPQAKTLDRSFPALAIEVVASGITRRWPFRLTSKQRASAMALLGRVGMADVATRPISRLSGGQLQRVFLARGLAGDPEFVLLDEPATGVDTPAEEDLYRILLEYREARGATVVMVTHDWEVARRHADLAVLLNRIQVGFGPPADVLTPERLRAAYRHAGHALPEAGAHG